MVSYTEPTVGLQLVLDKPPGPKVRYLDFVGSPSRATLAVPLARY